MDPVWLLILLPLAAVGGWFMAVYDQDGKRTRKEIPEAYFKGLNLILNEEPDEALRLFLKLVEVDSDTVEMHLALGNLFRRQGEVERATRIHYHLFRRTDLEQGLRSLALFELAQDYFRAGLYDRAEEHFLVLRKIKNYTKRANGFLFQIYEQEREWEKAIKVALQLNSEQNEESSKTIAHLYCELAEGFIGAGANHKAENCIQSAFKHDSRCLRAVIQSGRLESMRGNHVNAIAIWRGIEYWHPDAIGEVVEHVCNSYRVMGDLRGMRVFLESALDKSPDPRIINALVELTNEKDGRDAGQKLFVDLVRKFPSIESLHQLIRSNSQLASGRQNRDYSTLAELLSQVTQSVKSYYCKQCGFQSQSLHWQCPGCKGWGTVQQYQYPSVPINQDNADLPI